MPVFDSTSWNSRSGTHWWARYTSCGCFNSYLHIKLQNHCLWEAPSLLRFKSFWSHLPLELFSLGSKSLFRLRQAEQLTGWINASVHQDTAQHLSNARQASWMLAMMQVIFSSEFSLFIRFSCHQILSRPTATPCQCSYKMFQVSASHWDPEEKAAQVWPLHRKGGE